MIFQNLISIFSKAKNKMFFNIRPWVKAIRKASTYLTEEPKKIPLIASLIPRFMVKEKR